MFPYPGAPGIFRSFDTCNSRRLPNKNNAPNATIAERLEWAPLSFRNLQSELRIPHRVTNLPLPSLDVPWALSGHHNHGAVDRRSLRKTAS